jgi:hypothetical protein
MRRDMDSSSENALSFKSPYSTFQQNLRSWQDLIVTRQHRASEEK